MSNRARLADCALEAALLVTNAEGMHLARKAIKHPSDKRLYQKVHQTKVRIPKPQAA